MQFLEVPFGETQETIDDLWQSATFVFDANVLLNFYRYSDKARKEFLRILTSVHARSWLPEQCVHEFLSNRHKVIRGQVKAYSDTTKTIGAIKETFAGSKGHPFISEDNFTELSSAIDKIHKELERNRSIQENRISSDEIKEKIADLFDGLVGLELTDVELSDLFEEGEQRYSEEIPPGYKDGNKYPNPTKKSERRSNFGDLILWHQLLDMAKKDEKSIILVTDDQKEDWWLIASGRTVGPRPELIGEFCEKTGQKILIYTPDRFLQLVDKQLGTKISENIIGEIQAEHELLSNLVFEIFRSCGGLIVYVGFYAVSELDAGDDFGQIIEAA